MASDAYKHYATDGGALRNLNLPAAAAGAGPFRACCRHTQGLSFTAGSGDKIRILDKLSVAAGKIRSFDVGARIELMGFDSDEFIASAIHGNWEVETASGAYETVRAGGIERYDTGEMIPLIKSGLVREGSGVVPNGDIWGYHFRPPYDMPVTRVITQKRDGTATQKSCAIVVGPVAPPVRGSRIVLPWTDGPVVLANSGDITGPSAQSAVSHTFSSKWVYQRYSYWVFLMTNSAAYNLDTAFCVANDYGDDNNIQPMWARVDTAAGGKPSYATFSAYAVSTALPSTNTWGWDLYWYNTAPMAHIM